MKKILKHLRREWYKYVLEIFVLVIGIYSAFALENWNDNRKSQAQEKALLRNIIQDLDTDLLSFEECKEGLYNQLGALDRLISIILTQTDTLNSININNIRRALEYSPIMEKNNLEMISRIQDEEIRRQLQGYIVFSERIVETQLEYESIAINTLRPYLFEKGLLILGSEFPLTSKKADKSVIDVEKLLNTMDDIYFQQIIQELKLKTEEFIYFINEIMKQNEELKAYLKTKVSEK